MERRRGIISRPASSEGVFALSVHEISERRPNYVFPAEVDCWSRAAESLTALSNKYSNQSTLETIDRVNRLIHAWPADDTLPAEGYEGVKTIYNKLKPGLTDIGLASQEEFK
jgi:SAGA-associated factor 29